MTEKELRNVIRENIKKELTEGPMDYLKAVTRLGKKTATNAVKTAAAKIAQKAGETQKKFATELANSEDETFKNNFPTDLEKLGDQLTKSMTSLVRKYQGALTRVKDIDSVKSQISEIMLSSVEYAFKNVK